MAFDFKKEYRELYQPGNSPGLVTVPRMNFIGVRGSGDPNEEGGAYQQAIGVLYAVAYTLKMSHRNGRCIEGFFDYVVPPAGGVLVAGGTDRSGLPGQGRIPLDLGDPGSRTLSPGRTLTGRWRRRPERRSWTAPPPNS